MFTINFSLRQLPVLYKTTLNKTPTPLIGIISKKMSSTKLQPASRLLDVNRNVWVEFTALAKKYDACNVGQGFPDCPPPDHVIKYLTDATQSDHMLNQYTRAFGHLPLVNNLSKLLSPLYGVEINPLNEILISIGGYGALFAAFQAFIQPGDEVIIVEPFFDCYQPMVKYSGGKCQFISLKPKKDKESLKSSDWILDKDELRSKFNKNTKAIVINTPNNPLGKVFERSELEMISQLCIEFDCLCISDEVYEWLTYDDKQHVRIASLPGMWERSLTIGSAGKTFSVTGWKLGWTIGCENLMKHLFTVHQNSIYTCPTTLQEALARSFAHEIEVLGTEQSYFKTLPQTLKTKRDKMIKILQDVGMKPIVPDGGYFIVADASNINVKFDVNVGSKDECWDYQFVKWMTINKKVAAIPTSAFYGDQHKHEGSKYVRFCFCKDDSTINRMSEIFEEWSNSKSS